MALLIAAPVTAQKNRSKQNVLDIKQSITDSNIVFPESFETNTTKMLEGWYMKNYTATDDRYATRPDIQTDDATFSRRLSQLPTVIEMPYNQIVRQYIVRYTDRGRAQVAALLGLGNYYMPIFEQALEEQGLPLELKYLPVIESGLDPNAVSKHGAAGLWQFMLATAKGLDMEVNSLVDERRDPYLSSKKAVKYLKDLHDTYGDWSLAIAAYNCGPGTVNKAIRRAGGDPNKHDFWSIYYFLPAETRGYVPAFIAANYVMNYYKDHNISPVVPTKPLVTDTLHLTSRVHFNQISKVLDIPVEELRVLNPQFRTDLIPGSDSKFYTLVLPSQQVHAYLMSEEDILNYDSEKYSRRLEVEPGGGPNDEVAEIPVETEDDTYEQLADAPTLKAADKPATSETALSRTSKSSTHKVKPGESLADIAALYNVTPEEIKSWNNLRRNAVRTGQTLRINVTQAVPSVAPVAEPAPTYTKPAAEKPAQNTRKASAAEQPSAKKKGKTTPAPAPKTTEHKLRTGDNLTTLAKKYGVSIDEIKKANGMTSDKLRAGETLKIPSKGSSSASSSKKSSGKSSSSSKKSGASKKKSSKKKK